MSSQSRTISVVRIGWISVPGLVASLIILGGLSIICEWVFGIRLLARFSPTDSSMKFNTSLVFLIYGLSFLCRQSEIVALQRIAKTLALIGLAIAALSLSQYLFHYNLGLDELFVRDHPNPDITSSPGRMSPLVAFNFLLTGAALLLWRRSSEKNFRPAEFLGIAGLVIPVIVTLGYLFSASSLYSFSSVTGVALITSLLFLVLHVGILAVFSEHGPMTILLSRTRGGRILRFLLPTSLGALILFDWLSLRATRAGLISEALVIPLGTIASGGVIALLIWRSARLLYEADQKEKQSFVELQNAYRTAEEANRMKDLFISVVSHELRTPLNAILGWVRIVRVQPTEENKRRALEVIGRQSENQLRLVEDLLDISRIISGKMRLEIHPVELENVVAEALETIRPAAVARNIEIEWKKPPETVALEADGDRLQQVFWNLFSNAVKFTQPGGKMSVALTTDGEIARIVVADTGQGIDAAFLPFVFDRFRQSDVSASRRSGGLGLGLSLVRSIVELHGGTVAAESAGAGRGAAFTVELPIH
ncbi:MAG: HAMP domain-containing histidine kinase [Acidobacteria bacterium]|nr:HAMP domain-containing histidine kinase [Acidobacteriota bacterium]